MIQLNRELSFFKGVLIIGLFVLKLFGSLTTYLIRDILKFFQGCFLFILEKAFYSHFGKTSKNVYLIKLISIFSNKSVETFVELFKLVLIKMFLGTNSVG